MSASKLTSPAGVWTHVSPARGTVAVMTLSLLVSCAVALGGRWSQLAAGGVLVLAVGAAIAYALPERLRRGFVVIELPVTLLIVEIYYSHARSASDLAQDPLDSGAMVKLGAVLLAAMIGGIAFAMSPSRTWTPAPFRLFALYTAAVFVGIWASVDPLLTGYRGVELAAGLLVVAGAYRCFGQEAVVRIERLLYYAIAALVVSVWLSVAISPSGALVSLPRGPLHWQVQGVYPAIASNGVGTLGLLLALWSLGLLAVRSSSNETRPRYVIVFAAIGVATLVAAQYRTGYAAFAAGLALLLALRGRNTLALIATVVAAGAMFSGPSAAATKAMPFLLRGNSPREAQQLSGRLDMWHAAIPYWRESPLFGRGLLTSTRLEVLPSIGLEDTATIHSTWIETLVGTGLVGTALLAACVLVLFGQALRTALGPTGYVVPAVLLLALIVRSVTGSSFESLGIGALLVMIFGLRLGAVRGVETVPSHANSPRPLPASPWATNR